MAAITEVMGSDDEAMVNVSSNLLYQSLACIYQNRDGKCQSKDHQVSFDEYWSLACKHLTVGKINELLQPNRLKTNVAEPLLKCLIIVLMQKQDDLESELAEDLIKTLREYICKEDENMNLVRFSTINILKIGDANPPSKDLSIKVVTELLT